MDFTSKWPKYQFTSIHLDERISLRGHYNFIPHQSHHTLRYFYVFISIIFWPSVLNVTKKSAVDPLAANFLNVKIKDTMFKGTKQLGHSAVSQKMPICWPYKPAIYTPPRGLHGRDCRTNKPSESL